MPVFTPISHEAFVADVVALVAAVQADDWTPDYIIGIGRGGLVPAVYLSHATGLGSLSVDWSAQVAEFANRALDRLAARTRGGERLLFVDDINDTGGTIGRLRDLLTDAAPGHVRFATLIDNIRSSQ
ncbi:MAG: phosphoribosyltransferase family protein, partial [Sphingomonas bacterium]|nr:phosphoribosyltransferase family protein [Sphingomonas bacterium]